MAAVARPSNRVLDALEHAVGAILLQTGAVFDDPDYNDSRKFSRTKLRLERVLPQRLASVHDALDSLEADLVRAKTIMSHDLSEARKSRLAQEQSKAQEVAASNAAPKERSDDVKAAESQSLDTNAQKRSAQAPDADADADVIMLDEPMTSTNEPTSTEDKQSGSGTDQPSTQAVGAAAQTPASTSQPQHAEVKTEDTEKSAQGQAQAVGVQVGSKGGDSSVTNEHKATDDGLKKESQKPEAAATDSAPDPSAHVEAGDTGATAEGDGILSNLELFGTTSGGDALNDVGNFDMPNPSEEMNTTDFLDNNESGDFSAFADLSGQEFDLDSFLDMDGDANNGGTDFSKIEFDDDFFNT